MTKKSRVYQILTFVFGILLIILLSIMGITAIQKSLSFNVSFNVKPQYLCRIELNDDLIFCNTTKNNEITTISTNASLNGNTLALSESFVGGLGANLNFAFYNYSGFKVKVSVGDKVVILDAYTSGNPTSKPLSLSNVSGQLELVFQEYVSYTITYNANNGTSATTSQEVAKGTNATLSVDTFTKEGYVISSWNTKPDGSGTSYANLSSISPSENITLYAQWVVATYIITCENDDTTNQDSSNPTTVQHGEKVVLAFTASRWHFFYPISMKEGESIDNPIIKIGDRRLEEGEYLMNINSTQATTHKLIITIPGQYVVADIYIKVEANSFGKL